MSDTIESTEVAADETAPETTESAPATETPAKAPRAKKEPEQPHACACSTFRYGDKEDLANLFEPECGATTFRVFAQGHDARLVSTLVNAQFDGYSIFRQTSDGLVAYDNAGHACATVSEPLGAKADKAITNAQVKLDAKKERADARAAQKAERDAEKATKKAAAEKAKAEAAAAKQAAKPAGPKPVAAKVVENSVVDDGPIEPKAGDRLIVKVGRGEYDADVEDGTGELEGKLVVRYRNMRGEEEVRDLELTRVLRRA